MRRWVALLPRRSRLRVFDGRCSRSSFHNRCVRLGLTTRPSDLAMACALRQPHRGCPMAISRSRARSRCSPSSGCCGPYCCTERCWPTTRQARRCETPNRSTSTQPLAADGRGSPVSPADLLEHVDVEGLLGDQLLEPLIFPLKLLEPFGVFGFHPGPYPIGLQYGLERFNSSRLDGLENC